MRMPPTFDRKIAQAIAYKRIVTGAVALMGGVVLSALVVAHGGAPIPLVALGLAAFFGGGAWMLRDGIRLRRELRR